MKIGFQARLMAAAAGACVMTAGIGYLGVRLADQIEDRAAYVFHNYTEALGGLAVIISDTARIEESAEAMGAVVDPARLDALRAESARITD
jgi:hypothetical protein